MNSIRRFSRSLVVLAVILGQPLIASAAQQADMILVHADTEASWYVNTRTLVRPAPGAVSFWSRMIPAKSGRAFGRMGVVLEHAGKDPDRLEYVQILQELDCTTAQLHVWNVVFYDRQNRIILSSSARSTVGQVTAFQQEASIIRNSVCSTSYETGPEPDRLVAER